MEKRECHHLVQTWCLPLPPFPLQPPSNPVSIGEEDLGTSDLSIAFMWSKMCILRETTSNYEPCVLISFFRDGLLSALSRILPCCMVSDREKTQMRLASTSEA